MARVLRLSALLADLVLVAEEFVALLLDLFEAAELDAVLVEALVLFLDLLLVGEDLDVEGLVDVAHAFDELADGAALASDDVNEAADGPVRVTKLRESFVALGMRELGLRDDEGLAVVAARRELVGVMGGHEA